MISLDTNLLVRIVTRDDPAQTEAVLERIEGQPLFLAKTVLLELEWVLRHTYELSREAIALAFKGLLDLQQLQVEDLPFVTRACAWHVAGMDFADALHLASSSPAELFLTLDQKFSRVAKRMRSTPPVERIESAP